MPGIMNTGFSTLRRAAAAAVLAALLACLGSGCRSVRDEPQTYRVTFLAPDRITVRSETTHPDRLVAALRAAGARPLDRVQIALCDGLAPDAMARLIGQLKDGGYPRVIFTRPRRASAYVNPPKPPTPDPR
jgi:hypothetical protein